MRTKAICLAIAIVLAAAASSSAQQQRVVHLKPGFATVIVAPTAPELVTIGNSKHFTVQNSGNYIVVKPVVSSGSTNMFIKAGGDSYNLVLVVSEKPDLEVRLMPSTGLLPKASQQSISQATRKVWKANGKARNGKSTKRRKLQGISRKAMAILPSYLKTPRPYTYSVKNSGITLAVDYMVQVDDKLYMICTLINESSIPYDIGFVGFKIIERKSSYIFFQKTVKESELEPISEFYKPRLKPGSATRLLFVFDKLGFKDESIVRIKCIEESGNRDLVLELPASFVE